MKQTDIIVGLERKLDTQGQGSDWNHKKITWLILNHTPTATKQHTIELQLTLLSSERIVTVDGVIKHRTLCSFGFKCEFDVSDRVKGRIEQDGFSFELFLNGKNYDLCAQQQYAYQPPKINNDGEHWLKEQTNKHQPKIKPPVLQNVSSTKSSQSENKQSNKPAVVSSKVNERAEESIKSSQNELMKLLIQQKKERQALKK